MWRIVKHLDLNRLPASRRYKRHDRKWKRYEKPMRGHPVQVDPKFIAPLASLSRKEYDQFTAIDDCTRLRVLRIYDRLNQKTAIQFAGFLPDKFPFRVEVIQTDNGSEFQSSFHWHPLDRGTEAEARYVAASCVAAMSGRTGRRSGGVPWAPARSRAWAA